MEFNREKFKTVLSHIIGRCENKANMEKTVICNLLYFSDFDYYEKYENSITNETYIKDERGPYPFHFDETINEMLDEGLLIPESQFFIQKENPDTYLLNTEELAVINEVIDRLSDLSSNEVNEYSQGDMPWMIAEVNEDLDYEYVFYRDPEYSVRKYDN